MSDVETICRTCGAVVPAGGRFCSACGTPVEPSVSPAPAATAEGDEMRPITALFADIVGSTSLGERLGPDEVKALVGECVSRMSRAVEEFGGTVQAYMGDGICAYFGVPAAHEDDEERAARAGMRITQLVAEYGRDIEAGWGIAGFNVRVGINSGPAAVGLVGGSDPQEVALGDTTNVAARLQSAADPGTISVGDQAARRLAGTFELESLGPISVKGRAESVLAYRLLGGRPDPEADQSSVLVGREAERAWLVTVLDDLVAGRGQVLLISGDTGLGKTRMLGELETIAGGRVTWLEGRCLSYGGDLLYWPFVEMLRKWLGVAEGEPEVAVRTRLRARLAPLMQGDVDAVLPALGRLLSVRLDADPEDEMVPEGPSDVARQIRSAYRAWIQRLARERPVVMAIDDLHWADPSTRELAEDLLELTDGAPVLLAGAFRQETTSEGWKLRLKVLTDYFHRASEVPLRPLTPAAADELLSLILPGGMLDPETRQEIVTRAEGNPLYLQELLRAVVESAGQDRSRTWTLPSTGASLLPSNLESLFISRIDRLPQSARRLAQAAAVAGRTFPVRVAAAVLDRDDVADDLAVLLRAEIVRELRRYPELECSFQHGLLQQAALSTLTPARRRLFYGRAAHAYEELYSNSLEDRLEILALYYYRSDEQDRALDYLERAGDRA
ncbi:MAG TPA: adenylate/guanylate cyclase domain-containing protein, partial [Actinomycetota bacterium]|nr:adenylate/guanylate cyclase domain-containing protein [Actinomycetota bacterium]